MGAGAPTAGRGALPVDHVATLRDAVRRAVLEKALELCRRLNPQGWSDAPADEEERRSVILAEFEAIREPPTCICGAHMHVEHPDFRLGDPVITYQEPPEGQPR
jgi:hypothetical protein